MGKSAQKFCPALPISADMSPDIIANLNRTLVTLLGVLIAAWIRSCNYRSCNLMKKICKNTLCKLELFCGILTKCSTFYRATLCIRGTSHGPVSVCVCPSVTSRCSTKTVERIELVFGVWASFRPSYTVLKGYSVISKNKGTSLWNFVLNSWLGKFSHGISIVETCYQLSSRKMDAQSVINRAVVGQLSR